MRRHRGRERREPEAEPPHEKHRERKCDDAVGVKCAELVGELLRGRLSLLGFLDERDDFLQRTLGGGPGDHDFDRAPQIDGAGQRGVADFFRTGVASPVRFDSSAAVLPLAISRPREIARRV